MSVKFHAEALTDPATLEPGDQVAFLDSSRGFTLVTTDVGGDEAYCDVQWRNLWNMPAKTDNVWGHRVPTGSTAMQFGHDDWKIMPMPRVLARRKIQ